MPATQLGTRTVKRGDTMCTNTHRHCLPKPPVIFTLRKLSCCAFFLQNTQAQQTNSEFLLLTPVFFGGGADSDRVTSRSI